MHIVIDARIINSSTGRYVERLLTHLQKIDKQNKYTVLVLGKDLDYWKPKSDNFSIAAADFDNYSFAEQFGFKKFLEGLKPDLVHFCMPQQPVLYKGKKITTFHDLTLVRTYNSDKNWLVYHVKQFIGRFIFKSVAKNSDLILAPSEFTKNDLMEFSGVPDEKIRVTYEASEFSDIKPKRFDVPFEKYLVYVGSQSDYKNIRNLANAHQRLLRKHPSLGLVLVGSKNAGLVKNEELFSSRDYKNILFTGFLPDEEVKYLYKNCTAYVFPSLMEGFGLPGLEAMESGAPVVSSNATCLPEIYGEAAHYFNPKDVGDIAKSIDEVISNEKLRQSLITKGREQSKKYSWEKMATQTHEVYLRVVGGG